MSALKRHRPTSLLKEKIWPTRKAGKCNSNARRRYSRSGLSFAKSERCMHSNCYSAASDQNSNAGIVIHESHSWHSLWSVLFNPQCVSLFLLFVEFRLHWIMHITAYYTTTHYPTRRLVLLDLHLLHPIVFSDPDNSHDPAKWRFGGTPP